MNSGRIRTFASTDVCQVARLHHELVRTGQKYSPDLDHSYRSFFHDVYLGNPWYEERLSSLVYEEADGRITGFLGVMPRSLRIDGLHVQAAVSSMFMVEPSSRSSLAGVLLMKAFLDGPQDLSLADESSEASRKLWERLGGRTSTLNSIYWTLPLRLASFMNLRVSRRDRFRALSRIASPFCKAIDTVAGMSRRHFAAPTRLQEENLDIQTMLECSRTLWDSQKLRPEYQEHSLQWLLDTAKHDGAGGKLQKLALRNADHEAVGWYVYHLSKDGFAELLQIGFKPDYAKDVLDHLLHRTWSEGAIAVSGRMDRQLMPHLGSNYMMRPRYWTLLHSRKPELMDRIDRGEGYLSRLEGEWCMQFHIGRYKHWTVDAPEASISVTAETGGVEVVESLARDWRQLCDEAPGSEPFYSPEWIAAYLKAFEQKKKVVVVTARTGEKLQAILPLIEERTFFCGVPVTQLRGPANCHSCRFDMVRASGEEGEAAVRAIWKFLAQRSNWDILQLPSIPEGGSLDSVAETAHLDGFPVGRHVSMQTPYLPLTDLGETNDPLMQTSSNFRSNLRRRERQLKAQGNLAVRRVNTADPEMLQRFYDLERSGWKGEEGTAIACCEHTRQFYDEIACNGERYGYLSLFFLEFNGQPVAAQFGVTHAGRYFMPKMAFDEKYRKSGPGHLLICEVMRDCVEKGISEFDFIGPWAEYKAEWTSATRAHFTQWIFRKNLKGRLLHFLKFKLEANARKLARRLRSAALALRKPNATTCD